VEGRYDSPATHRWVALSRHKNPLPEAVARHWPQRVATSRWVDGARRWQFDALMREWGASIDRQ